MGDYLGDCYSLLRGILIRSLDCSSFGDGLGLEIMMF